MVKVNGEWENLVGPAPVSAWHSHSAALRGLCSLVRVVRTQLVELSR